MTTSYTAEEEKLVALWERHMRCEFVERSAAATIETMTPESSVNHVPVMTGGRDRNEALEFYARHFIPKIPADMKIELVARTVGQDRVVDEMIVRFTHDIEMDWMLPGVPPTGRKVEVPMLVSVEIENGAIAGERIYWDQACVLVQLGLLDPAGLPVAGAETAHKILDHRQPSNELIQRAR